MIFKNDFKLEKLSKEEVWRYLGHNGQAVTKQIEDLTSSVIDETLEVLKPKAILQKGDLNYSDKGLSLLGISLPGQGVKDLLSQSHSAAFSAVTLGIELDQRIKSLEFLDLPRAVVMDACASVAVEEVCDQLSLEFEEQMKEMNYYTTERFSPGYSDLPLSVQPDILRVLDAGRKIGLSVSQTCLLFPRKSVTAITGVMDEPRKPRGIRCNNCILKGKCKFGICRFSN